MFAEEYVGYEKLLAFLEERGLQELEGDIIEIGAYKGGGTVKLARFASRCKKKVFAVDTFDPALDSTVGKGGVAAKDVYGAFLEGRSMLEVYLETTQGFDNIITVIEDSKKVEFPPEQRFCFGFVDGCHQMSYVENDFWLIWPHLVSGGVIGFHDYRFEDWPEVTPAVERLVREHRSEIREINEIVGTAGILSILITKR
jgi:hypothetical protein